LVITAGQQARSLLPLNPFLGATEAAQFPKPYVKWSVEPARAEDVPAAIAHAWQVAMQRPFGPTLVSIPADDWAAEARPVAARRTSPDQAPDPALLAEAAALLAAARNPVVVAGAEIDAEGAGPSMVALAEALRAPVWAAPFASRIAFPEDHPLFAGFMAAAPNAVGAALAPHDLVLVVGAPVFTFHVPGDCAVLRDGTPIIQMSTDGEAIAAAPAGLGIQGSLRLGLPALASLLPPATRAAPAPRPRPAAPSPGLLTAELLFHTLARLMPRGAVVVEEAPSHRPALQAQLPIRDWGGFLTMASGGLGYSLPAAVGVALAQRDAGAARRVVAVIGDGSMLYSIQALWTAAQHGLPLTVLVVNNAGYGAMRSFSRVLGVEGAPGIDLPGLDFPALAQGMGVPALRVADPAALEGALAAALAHPGPMLVDVAVDAAIPELYRKH
jgi:benzoylformate decarboxylase